MGVLYTVLPLDGELRDWLRGEGLEDMPSRDGRNPTPLELREALVELGGIDVSWHRADRSCSPWADLEGPDNSWTVLRLHEYTADSVPCGFYFSKGSPDLVTRVVAAIAGVTGPLVIYPDTGGDIEVVY